LSNSIFLIAFGAGLILKNISLYIDVFLTKSKMILAKTTLGNACSSKSPGQNVFLSSLTKIYWTKAELFPSATN
jgi:hypothetical protein